MLEDRRIWSKLSFGYIYRIELDGSRFNSSWTDTDLLPIEQLVDELRKLAQLSHNQLIRFDSSIESRFRELRKNQSKLLVFALPFLRLHETASNNNLWNDIFEQLLSDIIQLGLFFNWKFTHLITDYDQILLNLLPPKKLISFLKQHNVQPDLILQSILSKRQQNQNLSQLNRLSVYRAINTILNNLNLTKQLQSNTYRSQIAQLEQLISEYRRLANLIKLGLSDRRKRARKTEPADTDDTESKIASISNQIRTAESELEIVYRANNQLLIDSLLSETLPKLESELTALIKHINQTYLAQQQNDNNAQQYRSLIAFVLPIELMLRLRYLFLTDDLKFMRFVLFSGARKIDNLESLKSVIPAYRFDYLLSRLSQAEQTQLREHINQLLHSSEFRISLFALLFGLYDDRTDKARIASNLYTLLLSQTLNEWKRFSGTDKPHQALSQLSKTIHVLLNYFEDLPMRFLLRLTRNS